MQTKVTKKKGRKPAKKNKNYVFNGILVGLKEVLAHKRGEITLPSRYVDVPPRVDVKAIRTRLKMSQSEFAERFYFPIRTLQDWELGRNQPYSPIRAYLLVIATNPKMVEKVLRGPGAEQIARAVMPQSAA
jgi:putative transcriptional regulator